MNDKVIRVISIVVFGIGVIFFIVFLISVFRFPCGWYDLFIGEFGTEEWSNRGTLWSGLFGSLWAFLGVILFYLALIYQRKELKATVSAIKETNEKHEKNNQYFQEQIALGNFWKLWGDFAASVSLFRLIKEHSGGNDKVVGRINEMINNSDSVGKFIYMKPIIRKLSEYLENQNFNDYYEFLLTEAILEISFDKEILFNFLNSTYLLLKFSESKGIDKLLLQNKFKYFLKIEEKALLVTNFRSNEERRQLLERTYCFNDSQNELQGNFGWLKGYLEKYYPDILQKSQY